MHEMEVDDGTITLQKDEKQHVEQATTIGI